MSTVTGMAYLMASLPVAFTGLFSGIAQGRVAASGIQILAKKPEHFFKGVMFSVMGGNVRDLRLRYFLSYY